MLDTHCEKNLIINNRTLKYSGIFRADELFAAINRALEEKGYEKREKKTEELVTESAKKTVVELRPYKEKTHYLTLMIKIKITLDHIKEVIEEVQGVKKTFAQGDVEIVFDSWTLTDYEERWGMKPWVYFLKGFVNKFIYAFPMESGFVGELGADTAFLYGRIKKLLNSYKEEVGKKVSEEEIRKQMQEDIVKESEQEWVEVGVEDQKTRSS